MSDRRREARLCLARLFRDFLGGEQIPFGNLAYGYLFLQLFIDLFQGCGASHQLGCDFVALSSLGHQQRCHLVSFPKSRGNRGRLAVRAGGK